MRIAQIQDAQGTLSQDHSADVLEVLRSGSVVVYPTDTLYGLGVDACSKTAIAKLYALKKREQAPVSVLMGSVDHLLEIVKDLSDVAEELIRRHMPGALTVITHTTYDFAPQLFSQKGTIGFRVPGDRISTQLPRLLERPITTTSVNPAGLDPATSRAEVEGYYANEVELMLDIGVIPPSLGSTVIDLTSQPFTILREGEISRHALQEFLK